MELTNEQKKAMVEQRLQQYKQQIFSLEMDRTALDAVGDIIGTDAIDTRIEALRKAYDAVERML